MGPAVRLRSAVCLIGRFPALAGVDLIVDTGALVAIHGPNGAGKTTLLRAVAGLVAIAGGEAEVLGTDLCRDRKSVRPRVGLLGAGSALYDDLTVEENIHFWARAQGRSVAAAEAAMATLGLADRLRHVLADRLSTGQRRRASLAVLVARDPDLWLLDEPHAGLDAEGRDLLDGMIRGAVSAGATVILASHELERAGVLGAKSLWMAGGRMVQATPPKGEAIATRRLEVV